MNTKETNQSTKELYVKGLESYPASTVILENALMFIWLLTGSYLCYTISEIFGWAYLGFSFSMVFVVMRIVVCRNCYYHGKVCHTGWGKLSALYAKQGEITRFGCGFSGKLIPVFYGSIFLIPLVLGILNAVPNFNLIDFSVLFLFATSAVLSSFTLRKKSCSVCKMKNICPGAASK